MNAEQYGKMNVEELKALYVKESQRLNDELLSGIDWKEIKPQSDLVCSLAKILDRKLGGVNKDPATINLRKAK